MNSTVNRIFHFSYFDPDYPTSGLTVTGLASVYCTFILTWLTAWGDFIAYSHRDFKLYTGWIGSRSCFTIKSKNSWLVFYIH
jgi:hypothetical protein